MKKFLIALLLGCLLVHCVGSRNRTAAIKTLPAAALQVYGRHFINQQQQVELISPAAHFGFTFTGTECRLYATIPNAGGHNYLQYEMDGVYKKRIRIDGSSNAPVTITAATPDKHTVWIYKATEAHTGPVWIEKIM